MKAPYVKILDRYIIRKFLGTFLFTILIAVTIVVIFDLSEKIDKFVGKATLRSCAGSVAHVEQTSGNTIGTAVKQ